METERVVTHRTVASVARIMGYTPYGLTELVESCNIKKAPLSRIGRTDQGDVITEWVVIGISRRGFSGTIQRVSARFNFKSQRYEFSVGSEAFALTTNAQEAQRIRDEIADEVVKRISDQRPALNPRFIKANEGQAPADDQGSTQGLSSPETMIITPVAPRDPRGLNGPQRRLPGPGNGKSGH